jgi:hypothetical protein
MKLIKTCFSLFTILSKSILTYVSRKSSLIIFLNSFALSFMTGTIKFLMDFLMLKIGWHHIASWIAEYNTKLASKIENNIG